MPVLVTGGAGYIGSCMVLDLLEAGESVVVLDNLSTGARWAVPPQATFVEGNVGDKALVSSLIEQHGVTEILHFAASIIVSESYSDPMKYYLNNTGETAALIDTAIRGGIEKFIFSSTAAVYGNAGDEQIDELTDFAPISPYGASKAMVERMLDDAQEAHGLRSVRLRYFNVAGADPANRAGQSTPISTHLIKIACEAVAGQRDGMAIFGEDYATRDGTCERDYVHVSDLVRAHRDALGYLRDGGASDAFNVGYGRGFTVREVIDAVKRVSGVDFPVSLAERRRGDPDRLVARAERIRARLGWTPRFDDLDTIIAHALAWERQLADDGRMARRA